MSEWQPIETAPRDGTTRFLGYSTKYSQCFMVREIMTGFSKPGDLRWDCDAYYNVPLDYWQPLPAHPGKVGESVETPSEAS